MKRIIAILCALVLLLSMAACGSTAPTTTANDEGTNLSSTEKLSEPESAPAKQIIFTEAVIVDNEYCTIKITGIDQDNLWGYTLNAYLENKTADQTLMFSIQSATVNNVMADPFFASEVAPGKKSNENISFSSPALEKGNITDFTQDHSTIDISDARNGHDHRIQRLDDVFHLGFNLI